MKHKWIYLLVSIIIIMISQNSYTFNRWFKISPGIRLAGTAVDQDSRAPSSGTVTRFDFAVGGNLDIQLEKFIGLDIELLYYRRGSDNFSGGKAITLHYIAVPTLLQIWVARNKMAFVVGPVHNFLIGAEGSLTNPNVTISKDNIRFYDMTFALGVHYVIATFGDGYKFVGDFRFEFGLTNVFKDYRPEIFNYTTPYLGFGLNF